MPKFGILTHGRHFNFKREIQMRRHNKPTRTIMSKQPVDFGASATLIQAWYRQRATRKLLRIAQARFDLLERSICKEIQASFPCYQYSNNQDFFQRYLVVT